MSGVGAVGSVGTSYGSMANGMNNASMQGASKADSTKAVQDSGITESQSSSNIQTNSFFNSKEISKVWNTSKISGSTSSLTRSYDRVETKCEVTMQEGSCIWSLKTNASTKPIALNIHCVRFLDLKDKEQLAKLILAMLLLLKLLELLDKKDCPLFLLFGNDKHCAIVPISVLQEHAAYVANINISSSVSIQSTIEKSEFSSTVESISNNSSLMNSVNVVDATHRGMANDVCASMVKSVEQSGQISNLSAFTSGQPSGGPAVGGVSGA